MLLDVRRNMLGQMGARWEESLQNRGLKRVLVSFNNVCGEKRNEIRIELKMAHQRPAIVSGGNQGPSLGRRIKAMGRAR
jgi:hypothetical protein